MSNARALIDSRPVAVIGAGLVGTGWALVFARAGLSVRIHDEDTAVAHAALPLIEKQVADLTEFGLLTEPPEAILSRLSVAASLAEVVADAAYVQESVFERVEIKRALMLALDRVAGPDLVVGSSSSGIPASAFASGLGISGRVLIAHPVNPPYLTPVVEIVPSPETAPETVAFTAALMEAAGQSVVHVHREIEGFVLNRLQAALLREAWALVEDGVATCEDVDKTVRDGLGWRWSFMGPFETIDLNAPGGVADYAHRLGPLYRRIAGSRTHEADWSEALIGEVERQRRESLAKEALADRRHWRDRRLMAFSAARRKSGP